MFCSVRQPLSDLFVYRQMEQQNEKKFNSMIQDTVFRLQNCMRLLHDTTGLTNKSVHPQKPVESSLKDLENIPSSSRGDIEAAKKRAKKTRKEPEVQKPTNKNIIDENISQNENDPNNHIQIETYLDESQIDVIMEMIGKELSEPYSIYTYRYFLNTWPELTLLAYDIQLKKYIGVIVGKIDAPEDSAKSHNETRKSQGDDDHQPSKGYIAMLAVDETHRGLGIGTRLVELVVERMHRQGCDEVILETEVTNTKALNLYSRLGFIREKRLYNYYLNASDAFRLVHYRQ
ncbi:Acetyltransferase, GNAT family [Aphelenchoides bicaudatus]|nr:Acetyltransferase, GNAT family [Aphelenchoides bicaudatus]